MRAAPAVAAPVGHSSAWRAAQAALTAVAASALVAWLAAWAGESAAWGLAAALPAAAAAWLLQRPRAGQLAWDGQGWWLDGSAAQVTVALDFDRWLLLRLRRVAGAGSGERTSVIWLPATAAQAGAHWHGLRAALYSRAPESPPAAAPPTGGPAPD